MDYGVILAEFLHMYCKPISLSGESIGEFYKLKIFLDTSCNYLFSWSVLWPTVTVKLLFTHKRKA